MIGIEIGIESVIVNLTANRTVIKTEIVIGIEIETGLKEGLNGSGNESVSVIGIGSESFENTCPHRPSYATRHQIEVEVLEVARHPNVPAAHRAHRSLWRSSVGPVT